MYLEFSYLGFWLIAVIAFVKTLKRHSSQPLAKWSIQRKLHFLCWSLIAVICVVNGLRFFVKNQDFNFWAQIALGIQCFIAAIIPCGLSFFNKNLLIKIFRNIVFIALGIAVIIQAFQIMT